MNDTLILRPGALGDVLVVRGVVRLMKLLCPGGAVTLIAPGTRGRFLRRPGLADRFFDWERREVSWLFTGPDRDPPRELATLAEGAALALAYLDPAGTDSAALERKMRVLAPGAEIVIAPPAPESGGRVPIGQWLLRAAIPYAERCAGKGKAAELAARALAGKIITEGQPAFPGVGQVKRYAVIHPGSGNARKNWGVARYAALGKRLLELRTADGDAYFQRLVATSGEADGDLGGELARALPDAPHMHMPDLETLAGLLAGADLYVGNDSGVSHLAGMVATAGGRSPHVAVLFGPSDSDVWAPPTALTLDAGPDMERMTPDEAFRRIAAVLPLVEFPGKSGQLLPDFPGNC